MKRFFVVLFEFIIVSLLTSLLSMAIVKYYYSSKKYDEIKQTMSLTKEYAVREVYSKYFPNAKWGFLIQQKIDNVKKLYEVYNRNYNNTWWNTWNDASKILWNPDMMTYEKWYKAIIEAEKNYSMDVDWYWSSRYQKEIKALYSYIRIPLFLLFSLIIYLLDKKYYEKK